MYDQLRCLFIIIKTLKITHIKAIYLKSILFDTKQLLHVLRNS